ncbi:Patatin-like phospholipase [Microbacterium hydrocarbonoxydans]|uniref:Patatin-like phospholipase n=1 Tax=Microbacterium hydrocarbonoxydans TaxID=273678 RepID=A0A0M2HSS3_9MICO|nr:patatin-like phospholipase family protein [Microbacterium hydrocarbonoxydans]KJL47549.1 Patatin-like phospholipase [Microbacterium hydrocarbonoxydans]
MTRTALVLAGGGSTGNAWMIGVTAGLLEGGLDVTDTDLMVGTSAGATSAAQLATASSTELFEASLAPVPARVGPVHTQAAADNMARTAAIIAEASDAAEMRRRMGAAAIAIDPDGEKSAHWRGIVARRLPGAEWPDRLLRITAVDARTGAPVVFDRDGGVDLTDAVAASCSSGFAYAIGEERYIDGGYRRNENADLAAGSDRVLVLSPFGGRTRHPLSWGTDLATQTAELRASGSLVETIFPGEGTERMLGATAMDPSLRAEAARSGFDQGRALAERLSGFWR